MELTCMSPLSMNYGQISSGILQRVYLFLVILNLVRRCYQVAEVGSDWTYCKKHVTFSRHKKHLCLDFSQRRCQVSLLVSTGAGCLGNVSSLPSIE